jgi:hypothetical protein
MRSTVARSGCSANVGRLGPGACNCQIKGSDVLTQTRLLSQSVVVSLLGDGRRAERRGIPQWSQMVGVR